MLAGAILAGSNNLDHADEDVDDIPIHAEGFVDEIRVGVRIATGFFNDHLGIEQHQTSYEMARMVGSGTRCAST